MVSLLAITPRYQIGNVLVRELRPLVSSPSFRPALLLGAARQARRGACVVRIAVDPIAQKNT